MKHWILSGHEPIETDPSTWAKWVDTGDRVVCLTDVSENRVSTVFLGIDHNLDFFGPPLLFETMVFHNSTPLDEAITVRYTERYSTWDEAMAGHMAIVYRLTQDAKATP